MWSCCLCTCYVLSCYQVEISEYLIAQAEEEMERTGEKKAVRKLKKHNQNCTNSALYNMISWLKTNNIHHTLTFIMASCCIIILYFHPSANICILHPFSKWYVPQRVHLPPNRGQKCLIVPPPPPLFFFFFLLLHSHFLPY